MPFEDVIYYWDEFSDWCKRNDVSTASEQDYGPWWDCWKTAIDVRRQDDKVKSSTRLKDVEDRDD